MKKLDKNAEDNNSKAEAPTSESPTSFNYEEEQKKIMASMSPEAVDSMEKDNAIELTPEQNKEAKEDAAPVFDLDKEPDPVKGMQNYPPEFYAKQEAFAPAIEVTKEPPIRRLGRPKTFGQLPRESQLDIIQDEIAKPASERDLSNLDESMIMDLPQIKAASFKIIDMLSLKPKSGNVRFRWANFKNDVAGTLGRYYALGFKTAEVSDVDTSKTPIDPSMIDGTQIKYYDVLLLKINVLELMGLYKANVLKSINRLGKIKEKGLNEANRQFESDLTTNAGGEAVKYYNDFKREKGHAPVEFFTPGLEDSNVAGRR